MALLGHDELNIVFCNIIEWFVHITISYEYNFMSVFTHNGFCVHLKSSWMSFSVAEDIAMLTRCPLGHLNEILDK